MNGRRFFLSHSGLDVSAPFIYQHSNDLLRSRAGFYENAALPCHICIFGHTPTPRIRNSRDCSVWFDPRHKDKINIDCGCVHGGALAAIRLDDGETFYVKSKRGNHSKYSFSPGRFIDFVSMPYKYHPQAAFSPDGWRKNASRLP